ncbi:TetR/AcrR family transcriptional regulator [Leucobacter allii]|uniref:TetR/AcrR family transcriptional regulator n=1 Tax=Leucobacter allii TaxID=2932247 RepID=UPI001FD549F6|nr:TetR/AcrR family transcriptional regulator [Leucobacter allii]UOR01482.1 TetR/AcrR family transcriptional regulator [Leucobacter allii]
MTLVDAAGAAPAPGSPVRRGPGRPRDAGHDARILSAAIALMERGEEVTVGRVVELSGVSRAAIYRRWPSMTDLLAAALDQGREAPPLPYGDDLLGALLEGYTSPLPAMGAGYSEERLRLRLRLALSDRRLAQAYWRSHVSRRRSGITALLQAGIARGELREDLDLEATIDLMNGVFYYQYVVRGVSFDDPSMLPRCREALRIVWRGIVREPDAHPG